jgi:hypothetical protein
LIKLAEFRRFAAKQIVRWPDGEISVNPYDLVTLWVMKPVELPTLEGMTRPLRRLAALPDIANRDGRPASGNRPDAATASPVAGRRCDACRSRPWVDRD